IPPVVTSPGDSAQPRDVSECSRRSLPPEPGGRVMPKNKTPQLKDPELYDRLREDGASAEKAARISNAAAKEGREEIGRRGGEAEDYEDRTVAELRERAK